MHYGRPAGLTDRRYPSPLNTLTTAHQVRGKTGYNGLTGLMHNTFIVKWGLQATVKLYTSRHLERKQYIVV